ncbi:endonuclease [Marinobacter sp.]|jgi:deoxyribonuclease-1|uniref:endonuclease n=1 Tax=Marinobacter sp. TaxID=50741 RepID=UPI00198C7B8A|nr:endonuclease [Marinobacter sp.]MBC7191308.1 endonuclease [Marinobacter sp.]
MKNSRRIALSAFALLAIPVLVIGQNTRFTDPDTVIRDHFWGDLYAQGGNSFFCNHPFASRGFTLTAGYVYPMAEVRRELKCGTASQCLDNNAYRQIASDLHNIVPVNTRIEMKRRNARFNYLPTAQPNNECGIKTSGQFVEPPTHAKGDVARTVAYMVSTYNLPWAGTKEIFHNWNRIDPPDDKELARHNRIADIQGNRNPFMDNPGRVDTL